MLASMPKVAKVTVSLPAAIFDFVERRRADTGATRSEVVAEMLAQVKRAGELAEREARYREAYARQPETPEEAAFLEAAAAELLANVGDESADVRPKSPSSPAIRAAGEAARSLPVAMRKTPVRRRTGRAAG